MIHLTDSAIAEIKRLMTERTMPLAFVRFGIESGGCSGLQYSLDFDNEIHPEDQVFDQGGLRVVCDEQSLAYLTGLQVDFSSRLMGGGFKFTNPNASRSCGCGTSFRV
jgi:iron-sulfur cluster assembly accessory protein